jgi:hypothetical protein
MFIFVYPGVFDLIGSVPLRMTAVMLFQAVLFAVAYMLVAAGLFMGGTYFAAANTAEVGDLLDYNSVRPRESLPVKYFAARDGTQLAYRHYPLGHVSGQGPVTNQNVLILHHEAAMDSRYFQQLARYIGGSSIAQVCSCHLVVRARWVH